MIKSLGPMRQLCLLKFSSKEPCDLVASSSVVGACNHLASSSCSKHKGETTAATKHKKNGPVRIFLNCES